jgi:glycosyltransferase involved in cell wall biosynthesis
VVEWFDLGTRSMSGAETTPALLSILVPSYQEARTLGVLLDQILAVDVESLGFTKEIIVCDDGSTDETAEVVARATRADPRIRFVRHARNRGKGAAIRTALDLARGEWCIVQDADLEYEVEDYIAMLGAVRRGAQVVYGSRFLARSWPEGMRLTNWLGNRVLTLTANLLYGLGITDEATGPKMFRTELLRSLGLEAEGFEFCSEVTAKLGRRGIAISETPAHYSARTHSAGKKLRLRHGWQALWTLVLTERRGAGRGAA